MRIAYLSVFALLLTACGGRKIDNAGAQRAIVRIPLEVLQDEDIEVVGVRQVGGSEAIAETRLKTAFRLEKVKGKWEVRDVRIGHGEWEKVTNLSSALESVRTEETRAMLDRIADAIGKYRDANGEFPPFKDYISLSDILTPKFLTPLIRLDAWRRPLGAEHLNPTSILLISAGPDGKFGTPDDVRRTVLTNDD